MKDTPPEIEAKFARMIMARSGEERLKMGCSMHASSRELITAAIGDKDPVALKKALFLRFYGDEFDPQQRKKILLALRKAAERKRMKALEVPPASRRTRRKRDVIDVASGDSPGSVAVRDAVERYGQERKKAKRSRRMRTKR